MATESVSHSPLLTTKQAAHYLGFQDTTLRNARYTGRLAGVEAPAYRKLGTVARYDRAVLEDWLGQFAEQTCTTKSGSAS